MCLYCTDINPEDDAYKAIEGFCANELDEAGRQMKPVQFANLAKNERRKFTTFLKKLTGYVYWL